MATFITTPRRARDLISALVLVNLLSQSAAASDPLPSEGMPPLPHVVAKADLSLPVQPPAPQATTAAPLDAKEIVARMLSATVLIVVRSQDGQERNGTGWVIDSDRRLIVTNEHVISLSDDVEVYFPEYVNGRLKTDYAYYARRGVSGTAIDSDSVRDLALIQVEELPPSACALPLAADSPSIADHVHAVGGAPEGSGGLWIYTHGHVRGVVHRTIATGHQITTVESDMAVNRGNSGGAVVNDLGEVVAVVEGADNNARLVSLFVDVTELRAFLDEAVSLVDATTPADLVKRGNRHLARRRHYHAIRDFTQALTQDPNLAEALSGRGWGLYHTGDYQTALADFNEAIRRNPNLVVAYQGRGLAQRELGNNDVALEDFTQAIRLDALYYDSYNERGLTYYRMQDYAKAEADFTRALERNDRDAQLWANRGDARQELGRHTEALTDLLKAVELAPENAYFHFLFGYSQYHLGNYQDAAVAFYGAAERDPQNPTYFSWICDSFQMQQLFQDSLTFINKAIELNNQNGYFFASRGWSYQQLQNHQAALTDYNEAIRLQDNVAWYYARRGEVLLALGNEDAARQDYQSAAQLDPERFASHVTQVSASRPIAASTSVAGRWRYQGRVNGVQVDMRAHLSESGNFAYVWRTYLGDGRYVDTTERGSYAVQGDNIVFSTGTANYMYPYAATQDSLTIRFTDDNITLTLSREG